MELTLTRDQQNVYDTFCGFLANPDEQVLVIEGYAGTGKSTLVDYLMKQLPKIMKTVKLISPRTPDYAVKLTATTNKAAENLSHITNMDVSTIQSHLGLIVQTDYATMKTKLIPKRGAKEHYEELLFIDEASYVDSTLLDWLFKMMKKSKIVLMGDPAQLTQVGANGAPVFKANFNTARLTEVMRQAKGNPILDLATKFRETVKSGQFFSFSPDGQYIRYMDRGAFDQAIEAEFIRPDWHYQDSKILAWTNKRVIDYNHRVNDLCSGKTSFSEGDYAVVNSFLTLGGGTSFKTDQTALITKISGPVTKHDVVGKMYELDGRVHVFCPDSLQDRKDRERKARAVEDLFLLQEIDTTWADLRSMFACTINKSQGSTYDRVFIDLDDIKRCNSGEQIARMLYVGVSRARHQVFLTGDLV